MHVCIFAAFLKKVHLLTNCQNVRVLFTANVVLEGACERVVVGHIYCDIPLGLSVIRGENVVFIGELVRYYRLSL